MNTYFEDKFGSIADALAQRNREDSRELPRREVSELLSAGLGKLRIAKADGGEGFAIAEFTEILIRLAEADSNIPQIFRQHFAFAETVSRLPDGRQRRRWLKEIADGKMFGSAHAEQSNANSRSLATTLRSDGARHLVSGRKFYSTGSLFADYLLVGAVDDRGKRVGAVVAAGDPGVERIDDWDGIGQKVTASGSTLLHDAVVLEDGIFENDNVLADFSTSYVQLIHLATLAGIHRAVVRDGAALVQNRERMNNFAVSEVAAQDPLLLGVVGQIYGAVYTTDAAVSRLAHAFDRTLAGESQHALARLFVDVAAVQSEVVRAVLDSSSKVFDVAGASAVRIKAGLDRHWRNARTIASHNPVVFKPRLVGDYLVNDVLPPAV